MIIHFTQTDKFTRATKVEGEYWEDQTGSTTEFAGVTMSTIYVGY